MSVIPAAAWPVALTLLAAGLPPRHKPIERSGAANAQTLPRPAKTTALANPQQPAPGTSRSAPDREAPMSLPPEPPAAPNPDDDANERWGRPADRHLKQRGVALGLFAEDLTFSYRPLLAEIAELGATHVALIVPVYQTDGRSHDLHLHTRLSPTLAQLADAVRAARRERLDVTVFPIVRLERPGPGQWRGTLQPANRAAWFERYGDLLGDIAAVAAVTGAGRLVVGSELSTLDVDLQTWQPVIERVRGIFRGPLVYSANWDHYRDAALFDLVDEEGVVAYFPLRPSATAPADEDALTRGWGQLRSELERWRRGRTKPFVFTEVGYRSRRGTSATPWDEGAGGAVDLDEQRRAFEAFRRTWSDTPWLAGFYVWNWYGFGGPRSTGYTPRGKPAESAVRNLLNVP